MADFDRATARARCEAATPEPWFAHVDDLIGGYCVMPVDMSPAHANGLGYRQIASFVDLVTAEFIAHARTDLEAALAMLDAIEALVKRCDEYEATGYPTYSEGAAYADGKENGVSLVGEWLRAVLEGDRG